MNLIAKFKTYDIDNVVGVFCVVMGAAVIAAASFGII